MDEIRQLQTEFGVSQGALRNVVQLIDDGNTIPFIARYRKEMTGSLDDQVLREIAERLAYLRGLQKRKEEVCAQIEAAGALDDTLRAQVAACTTLAQVEDLYRPYRPKRRTRASVARERGLAPLAERIFAQEKNAPAPEALAAAFCCPEKEVPDAAAALAGALDIIAEQISDSAKIRAELGAAIQRKATLRVAAVDDAKQSVYSLYYSFEEPVRTLPGHRILAIDRGEREGFLKVSVALDRDAALGIVFRQSVQPGSSCTEPVRRAAEDAFDRLLFPSVEREVRGALSQRAAEGAIRNFSVNLRQLLMQPPVKNAVTMGLDPGYRTGCKVAVVDGTGQVLDTGVIYPAPPHNKTEQAAKTVLELLEKYGVNVVAIGNGTASRETEQFVASLCKKSRRKFAYMVVSEAGASVYSASKLAAAEFPQFDVSLRSAVSIARRLQDPLAELVKIDPKSIGVGQYQHDMPQKELAHALDGVVESCVNAVGVDLNTASQPLLRRVAGIGDSVAKNIVRFREENGAFANRRQLLKVPKLGKKAFEQCAGFLRVSGGANPLDATAVHPESYKAAEGLLRLCGYEPSADPAALAELDQRAARLGWERLAQQLDIGVPTLRDIASELVKPGRDPRDELPPPMLRTDVLEMKDLRPGMELTGTVRNVIDFGAFVDIGVHEDGLVHISQITNRYIDHPSKVLKVGDIVKVWVLDVDLARRRIALTMKGKPAGENERGAGNR